VRFAVISEVQANLNALQAALVAIDAQEEVERIVCAGDVVGLGPYPNEVLALLREREIETVRGNYDDAVAFERLSSGVDFVDELAERDDREAVAWTRRTLSAENLARLQALPRDLRLLPGLSGISVKRDELRGRDAEYGRSLFWRGLLGPLARTRRPPGRPAIQKVLVVHGSPRALNEPVTGETANSILEAIAREAKADVLISAHAGAAFHRDASGMTFVGVPGLSGHHTRPGEAEYAVVEVGTEVDVHFGRAAYDLEDHLDAMKARGMPAGLSARFGA
jgi:predicted phosphodiesterase